MSVSAADDTVPEVVRVWVVSAAEELRTTSFSVLGCAVKPLVVVLNVVIIVLRDGV